MYTLGLTGGLDHVGEDEYRLPFGHFHDAAAFLLKDGEVVMAVEEERLNRIKHTNKACLMAIRACLEAAGIEFGQIDAIGYYFAEATCDAFFEQRRTAGFAENGRVGAAGGKNELCRVLNQSFGGSIDPSRVHFVKHHLAHALGAYHDSGFDDALVLTIDGAGDEISSTLYAAGAEGLRELRSVPRVNSLGFWYLALIRLLGYSLFDEYKVMGLAPYGDPARYRHLAKHLYELLPEGGYRVHINRALRLDATITPRRPGEAFTQPHKDLAAFIQESLETVVDHTLTHHRKSTGLRHLCLTGGVAQNSTMNGRIMRSGLFDRVFIHPAAYDAGCAVGAAMYAHQQTKSLPRRRLTHVYWGKAIGDEGDVREELDRWSDFLDYTRSADVCGETAVLLAEGKVVGWMQGRSEFGPRALGNRSILGDPRPAENKDRINEMIKQREGYRPFAPSVLEERAADYFQIEGLEVSQLAFMTAVTSVRAEHRSVLQAVTHVDGSARIQTVNRNVNQRYWKLLHCFGELTGFPILLNTSFNNNVEPIVDSPRDGVVCFLTSGLDHLVIGEFIARKKTVRPPHLNLLVGLPAYVELREISRVARGGGTEIKRDLKCNYDGGRTLPISAAVYDLLQASIRGHTLQQFCQDCSLPVAAQESLWAEVQSAWSLRLLDLQPRPRPRPDLRLAPLSLSAVA